MGGVQAGDVLLLDTGSRFLAAHRADRNFALVAEVSNSHPPRFDRLALALTCAVAAIAVYVAGFINLFTAAATASAVMLASGCLSGDAARRSVKWEVIVTIASAFGLSNALEATGTPPGSHACTYKPRGTKEAHSAMPRCSWGFAYGCHTHEHKLHQDRLNYRSTGYWTASHLRSRIS